MHGNKSKDKIAKFRTLQASKSMFQKQRNAQRGGHKSASKRGRKRG